MANVCNKHKEFECIECTAVSEGTESSAIEDYSVEQAINAPSNNSWEEELWKEFPEEAFLYITNEQKKNIIALISKQISEARRGAESLRSQTPTREEIIGRMIASGLTADQIKEALAICDSEAGVSGHTSSDMPEIPYDIYNKCLDRFINTVKEYEKVSPNPDAPEYHFAKQEIQALLSKMNYKPDPKLELNTTHPLAEGFYDPLFDFIEHQSRTSETRTELYPDKCKFCNIPPGNVHYKDCPAIILDDSAKASHTPEIKECLQEAIDLMEAVIAGEYKPDSFTTQPWKNAISEPSGERNTDE